MKEGLWNSTDDFFVLEMLGLTNNVLATQTILKGQTGKAAG